MPNKLPAEPEADCDLCPRLVAFRTKQRLEFPGWHNAPVPSFGLKSAQLLIVGLAPGLRGANRTGRPFTGDQAGDLLYPTLAKFGFSNDQFDARPDDGLKLKNCRITNAVKCVPPANRPIGAEINACREFLANEIRGMKKLKVVLALGRVAHENVLKIFEMRLTDFQFVHGAKYSLPNGATLYDSYHCSRYNTNTGRLTPEMFEAVFNSISNELTSLTK